MDELVVSPPVAGAEPAPATPVVELRGVSKQFGETAAVSAGMAMSRLEQNTFSETQSFFGYTDGRTDTDSWYVSGRVNPSQSVGLEAFARYNRRENNSSYPVTGFYEPISTYSDPRMVMPRINKLSNIPWFKKSVRDIRAFKVEDWSDFTTIVKEE